MKADSTKLEALAAIVAAAGRILMDSPRRAGLVVKPDGSPVTSADIACEKALARTLAAAYPELTIIGEESAPDDGRLPLDEAFALIDPVDGTRAYVAGGDDFCICVAVLERGEPRIGIIGAPARGVVYAGATGPDGATAWRAGIAQDGSLAAGRTPLATRRSLRPPVALVSDRHGDEASLALLDRLGATERMNLSSALKFAILAEGGADIYPRLAPTMSWDTAAGQAILAAAGGLTVDTQGRPLRYLPGGALRNDGFIAMGDPALATAIGP